MTIVHFRICTRVSDNYITTVLLLLWSLEENPFFSVHKTVSCGINTDIDLNFEPEFDDEFDEIIKTIVRTECDIILPVELNLDMSIDKLSEECLNTIPA